MIVGFWPGLAATAQSDGFLTACDLGASYKLLTPSRGQGSAVGELRFTRGWRSVAKCFQFSAQG